MPDGAYTGEPTVTPAADRLMVACPECGCYGTHRETCSWSFAHRGEIWSFFAERLPIQAGEKS